MEASEYSLKQYYHYLIDLLNANEINEIRLEYLENLLRSENIINDELIIENIQLVLLRLLKKCHKHFQITYNISYAFSITLFLKTPHSSSKFYFNVLEYEKSFNNDNTLLKSKEMNELIKENFPLLMLGLLKYFINENFKFTDENDYYIINSKIKELIFLLLPNYEEINTILLMADLWISFVVSYFDTKAEVFEYIYESVVSIALIHWNHHISEFRIKVELLFQKCLYINYEENKKKMQHADFLYIIKNMETFQTFAYSMFWNVPFKYFAYLVGLKFIMKVYSISKFLNIVQDDLREGFLQSLQNKRVIRVETDLFKYCSNNLSYQQWKEIFHSVTCTVIHSKNLIMANNFSRLWLPIIIKRFPEYCDIIYELIPQNMILRTSCHSQILFSLLKNCRMKKVLLTPMLNEKYFLSYLENYFFDSEETKGELFLLLCNLHDQSILHSNEELKIILKFLKYNIKTNCTVLRQHIFSSFARFTLRLICSCVRTIKTVKIEKIENSLLQVLQFLVDLNDFFMDNIEPGCCYQRKVTSLTLYKIFMTYAVRNCDGEIRRNNLKDADKFLSFVQKQEKWYFNSQRNCSLLFRCLLDPSEEIQNLSFILLKTYFDLTAIDNRSQIFLEVLEMLKNNHFYKRNSGVSTCLSLILLCYNTGKNCPVSMLQNLNFVYPNFTEMFLCILENQILVLQNDILNSALYHPLDATIRVLMFLLTNVSSPEYDMILDTHIEKLISILELIVPILVNALFFHEVSDYAPSFEESDHALNAIIKKSPLVDKLKIEYTTENEFQLKPLNQILLNFIWITLKVCCEFESNLIKSRIEILNESQLIRCSKLTVMKLRLCRHKGVIEAAALSLSNIVRILTVHNICENWLESVLTDIIFLIECKSGAAVSRKSAGLSLLVQNIVANDTRPKKPFLTKCWFKFRRILDIDFDKISVNSSQELSQTHILHFLRVLIADSRNSSDLSIYFEEMTIVCLKTLNVPIWTIRNASLQLFGAIVPKLVGQKNSQNDFGIRRSFEEVFLCMPVLMDYIVFTFKQCVTDISQQKLTCHSNLVPLLIILLNVQVGNVNIIEISLRSKLLCLRQYVEMLLKSESYFIRELASKTFISLHSESEISVFETIRNKIISYLLSQSDIGIIVNENHLHGYLMVLKHAYKQFSQQWHFQKLVIDKCSSLVYNVKLSKLSLISATLLYYLGIVNLLHIDWKTILNHITCTLDNLKQKKHILLGCDEWTRVLIKIAFNNCIDDASFLELFTFCLNNQHCYVVENYLKIFSSSRCNKFINENINIIFDSLCESIKKYLLNTDETRYAEIVKCLFFSLIRLPKEINIERKYFFFNDIFDLLINLNYYEYEALNLRILCLLYSTKTSVYRLNVLLKKIHETTDGTIYHADIRLNSAQSMLLLSNNLCNVEDVDMKCIWLTMIDIIQDKNIKIRLIGCEIYYSLLKKSAAYSFPELVLEEMLNSKIMLTFLTADIVIDILWDTLIVPGFDILDRTDEITNPFDLGIVNMYKEDVKIIPAVGNSIINIIRTTSATNYYHIIKSKIEPYYYKYINEILKVSLEVLQNTLLISDSSYVAAIRCYYLLSIFIKLYKLKICSFTHEKHENAISVFKKNNESIPNFCEVENCCENLHYTFNFTLI